jgi:Mrp family chromosome partitioning ATPase
MVVPGDVTGLGDVLMDKAELDSVIRTSEWGIDVIGPGQPENRIVERLSNGTIDSILAVLRTRYDLVILDAPPAVVAGDALALASKVDASVLVVRANREQRGLVARLAGQLGDSRSELLGIVLNRPRGTAGGYFKKNYATMAKYVEEKVD